MRTDHVHALVLAATEDRRSYGFTGVPATPTAMTDYVTAALSERDQGLALPLVVRDLAAEGADGGRVVGSTRFVDLGFWRPADHPAGSEGSTAWNRSTTFHWETADASEGHRWITASTSTSGFVTTTMVSVATTSTGEPGTTHVRTDDAALEDVQTEPPPPGPGDDGARPEWNDPTAGASRPDTSPGDTPTTDSNASQQAAALPSVAEIGSTWLAASVQRTSVNTETKLLMLDHAFAAWSALRVCMKSDVRNARSRAAIERLGARFEGIRRAHMLATDGTARDTAYYSIVREEWPGVRAGLIARLAQR
jgi:hypothetical protein